VGLSNTARRCLAGIQKRVQQGLAQ
jgi:hypothetical protein